MKVVIETDSSLRQPVALVSRRLLALIGYSSGKQLVLKSSNGKSILVKPRVSEIIKPNTVVVGPILAGMLGIRDIDLGEVSVVELEKPSELLVEVLGTQPPSMRQEELVNLVRLLLANKVVKTNKLLTLKYNGYMVKLVVKGGHGKQSLVLVNRDTKIILRRKIVKEDENRENTIKNTVVNTSTRGYNRCEQVKESIASSLARIGFTVDTDVPVKLRDGRLVRIDVRALRSVGGIIYEIWVDCSKLRDRIEPHEITELVEVIGSAVRIPNLVIILAGQASEKTLSLAKSRGILVYTIGKNNEELLPEEIGSRIMVRIMSIFRELSSMNTTASKTGLLGRLSLIFRPKTSYSTV